MLTAKVLDRKTGEEVIGWNNLESLQQLKERIVTIIRQPEDMLIMVEGMNPFLFVNFNIILGNEEEPEMKMSIAEKMAFIKRALEMGASVDLHFHNFRDKESAKKAAMELSELSNLPHRNKSHNGSSWYKIKNEDYTLETSIYYDDEKFMEEDVILDGMSEEHVS